MTELVATGKCRAVGVSNFSIPQLQELSAYTSHVPISCNQIEAHPWLPNDERKILRGGLRGSKY